MGLTLTEVEQRGRGTRAPVHERLVSGGQQLRALSHCRTMLPASWPVAQARREFARRGIFFSAHADVCRMQQASSQNDGVPPDRNPLPNWLAWRGSYIYYVALPTLRDNLSGQSSGRSATGPPAVTTVRALSSRRSSRS